MHTDREAKKKKHKNVPSAYVCVPCFSILYFPSFKMQLNFFYTKYKIYSILLILVFTIFILIFLLPLFCLSYLKRCHIDHLRKVFLPPANMETQNKFAAEEKYVGLKLEKDPLYLQRINVCMWNIHLRLIKNAFTEYTTMMFCKLFQGCSYNQRMIIFIID